MYYCLSLFTIVLNLLLLHINWYIIFYHWFNCFYILVKVPFHCFFYHLHHIIFFFYIFINLLMKRMFDNKLVFFIKICSKTIEFFNLNQNVKSKTLLAFSYPLPSLSCSYDWLTDITL